MKNMSVGVTQYIVLDEKNTKMHYFDFGTDFTPFINAKRSCSRGNTMASSGHGQPPNSVER